MPQTPYLKVQIGNLSLDIESEQNFPVTISYQLEDEDNFEQKQSSTAFDITIPATQQNSKAANSFHNPNVEDLTAGEFFKSAQPCNISENGVPILVGKAFLKTATHTDKPVSYTFNCYGGNADWLIGLKNNTLLDFVNPASHLFTGAVIAASWAFDGTSETLDYVYAPVRYLQPFDTNGTTADVIATLFHMKPSISIYWILYRAFKSLGYQIQSDFMDTDYFRRLVMPWGWGSFLYMDDIAFAPFQFRAMCTHRESKTGMTGSWNEWVSPDSAYVNEQLKWADVSSGGIDGGFQGTPGLYKGVGMAGFPNNHDLNYYYPYGSTLGMITMGFEVQTYFWVYSGGGNNILDLRVFWFINGVQIAIDLAVHCDSHGTKEGNVTVDRELTLSPGDVVSCVWHIDAVTSGSYSLNWNIGAPYPSTPSSPSYSSSYFQNTYIKKASGTPVQLQRYSVFANYSFLDLLRGLVDAFNLSFCTDPINKTVRIEPTYPYTTGGTSQNGYYSRNRLDWSSKQDLSQESTMELYADNEQQFDFKMISDGNDAGIKIINQRYGIDAGSSRYLFPNRFQAGTKEFTNRFFSPVAHIRFQQWGGVTGSVPQLIAMIPENISNTSKAEDENSFVPKLAYYKGNVSGAGGWFFKPNPTASPTFTPYATIPFLFAVNYLPGGESDPNLSYSDSAASPAFGITPNVGFGLMRTFFLPRLAVMRNGKRYASFFNLNSTDMQNIGHREAIIIGGATYYIVSIDQYKPLADESTGVTLWKYQPAMQVDSDNCFPSFASVKNLLSIIPPNDLKYAKSIILITDLP